MSSENRITRRHKFEARIIVHLFRNHRQSVVAGWARDLSESGLRAFVAEQLQVGECVTLLVPLSSSQKQAIAARVARQVGTEYGFQFTALSGEQRAEVQSILERQPTVFATET